MSGRLRFVIRLIARDWRAGELGTLAAALGIAVIAATSVALFGDRLHRTMTLQAASILGADLSVGGHAIPDPLWASHARELGLRSAETAEFSSVLVEHDEFILVAAKAVPDEYPLRGTLKVKDRSDTETHETSAAPLPGEAWVEPRVLSALKLAPGDELTLGEKVLRITRLVIDEPGRRGDLYSLAPRVIFNQSDLGATGVIQPGSHVHYQALFSGEGDRLQAMKSWLKPRLSPGQHINDIHEDRPELGKALQRAERYLGLASIAVVMLAGVAIAMSARRHTERHYDLYAMLKCLGTTERDLLTIACLQFLIIGIVVTIFGCIAGWALQAGVAWLIGPLLPHRLEHPGLEAWLLGGGMGLFILAGFSLPPVLTLKRLPPLRVLRRDLEPPATSAWLVYGVAFATVSLLIWRYTQDWIATSVVLGTAALVAMGFAATGLTLIRLGRRLLPWLPLAARLGLLQLIRRPRQGITQILGFSLTLVALLMILAVRTELIAQWQRQIPANAPNYFALNLFEADLEPFRDFLRQESIQASRLYPLVRGRLMSINERQIAEILSRDSRAEGAIDRELGLTWSDSLPADNRVVAGEWPYRGKDNGVSVEHQLAERLGMRVGDRLTFNVAGQMLEARVGSLRSLRWDNLTPNFFMIFAPGVLDAFPHTWLTSFYVPDGRTSALTKMAKAFPGLSLLDIGKLINQFQDILRQITLAMEFMLTLSLGAGFTVLLATIKSTLDERMREDALLRAMGAHNGLLRGAQWMEFSSLGLMAGLLSVILSEIVLWLLYWKVFELPFQPHWGHWLLVPATSALLVGGIGVWIVRKVTQVSPARLLREL